MDFLYSIDFIIESLEKADRGNKGAVNILYNFSDWNITYKYEGYINNIRFVARAVYSSPKGIEDYYTLTLDKIKEFAKFECGRIGLDFISFNSFIDFNLDTLDIYHSQKERRNDQIIFKILESDGECIYDKFSEICSKYHDPITKSKDTTITDDLINDLIAETESENELE